MISDFCTAHSPKADLTPDYHGHLLFLSKRLATRTFRFFRPPDVQIQTILILGIRVLEFRDQIPKDATSRSSVLSADGLVRLGVRVSSVRGRLGRHEAFPAHGRGAKGDTEPLLDVGDGGVDEAREGAACRGDGEVAGVRVRLHRSDGRSHGYKDERPHGEHTGMYHLLQGCNFELVSLSDRKTGWLHKRYDVAIIPHVCTAFSIHRDTSPLIQVAEEPDATEPTSTHTGLVKGNLPQRITASLLGRSHYSSMIVASSLLPSQQTPTPHQTG